MNERDRLSILASIVEMLTEVKSWTGRMHIQKLIYLAQQLFRLSTGYDFVLYQRGPYSFGLDEDIRLMRSIDMLDIVPRPAPYGPTYVTTDPGKQLAKSSVLSEKDTSSLKTMVDVVGPKTANELELLATTLYVINEEGITSRDEIADRVLSLKPSFSKEEAQQAIQDVAGIRKAFS